MPKAREAHRRLRNTCRFLLGNLHDYEHDGYEHILPPPHQQQPTSAGAGQASGQAGQGGQGGQGAAWVARAWGAPRSVPALRQFDRYMLHQLAQYAGAVEAGYDALAFHKVIG